MQGASPLATPKYGGLTALSRPQRGLQGGEAPLQYNLAKPRSGGVWGGETSAFEMVLPPTLEDLRKQINIC